MKFIVDLFLKSEGKKRALGIAFLVLSHAVDLVPALAPYKEALVMIGSALGVGGVAHAAIAQK